MPSPASTAFLQGLPGQLHNFYYNVRLLLQCPAPQGTEGGMTKPVAVVTGGAGFIGSHTVDLLLERGYAVRVIDNLIGGREANLARHAGNPDLACDWRDIRTVTPDDPLFAGARIVIHFAGIGDIVPSIERPLEYL